MIRPRLVLCSGVDVPQNSPLRQDRKIVELDTLNPNSNTHLRIENVTKPFLQNLPGRLVDLLELATYVYTADCEASRELAWMDDKSTEPWSRNFHLVMPVRDPDFWNRKEVQDSLVSALEFLSSDQFTFEFVKLEKDRAVQKYLQLIDVDDTPFYKVNRVIMFSGGLDSLAGTVESAGKSESLVLVSHRPAPQINRRQKELADQLSRKYKAPIMHIPVWVNKSGFSRESTQRTRTFLFSALGVAVASVLKAGGVRLYENGVISLNWPLADETLQSRASRSTHPESLRKLQNFYRLVINSGDFSIDNPYVFKTKTEIVSVIGEKGAGDLISHSCSCVHTMFQPKCQWHCGRCGQCIDRRIAILAAGMEMHDTEDDYVSDVFTGPRPPNPDRPYNHNIAVNYARFAYDLNRMSEQEIGTQYNLELSRAARWFPNVGEAAEEFIKMHKRHAAAVDRVLTEQVRLHSQELVDGSLDKTSLLAMIGRREHIERASADSTGTDVDRPRDGNVFRRTGDIWQVVFDGEQVLLKDSKGVHYLAFLLKNPDQEFLALHLVMHEGGQLPEPNETYSTMSAEELAEEGLNSIGFTDEDVEKARSSVTHAINTVLKKLRDHHPSLHDHLHASLIHGRQFSYRPSTPPNWNF